MQGVFLQKYEFFFAAKAQRHQDSTIFFWLQKTLFSGEIRLRFFFTDMVQYRLLTLQKPLDLKQ